MTREADRHRDSRTAVPGVYRRNGRFRTRVRGADGRMRWITGGTLDEVLREKGAAVRRRREVLNALRRRRRADRAASAKSLAESYSTLRRAIHEIDAVRLHSPDARSLRADVLKNLYEAEDTLKKAIHDEGG